jgi:hypothetical protein
MNCRMLLTLIGTVTFLMLGLPAGTTGQSTPDDSRTQTEKIAINTMGFATHMSFVPEPGGLAVCTYCEMEQVMPVPEGDPWAQHYFPFGDAVVPGCNPGLEGGGGETMNVTASMECSACGTTSTCHQSPEVGPCHVSCGGGSLAVALRLFEAYDEQDDMAITSLIEDLPDTIMIDPLRGTAYVTGCGGRVLTSVPLSNHVSEGAVFTELESS